MSSQNIFLARGVAIGGLRWLKGLAGILGAVLSRCRTSEVEEMSAEQLAEIGVRSIELRARWVDGTESRLVSESIHVFGPDARY